MKILRTGSGLSLDRSLSLCLRTLALSWVELSEIFKSLAGTSGAFAWRVCHSLAHLGGHHRSIRMAGMSLARSPWRAPQEHSHGGYVTHSLTLAGTTGAFAWRVCHSLAHLGGHHRSIRMAGMSLARSPWRAPQEHSHGGYVTRSLTLAGTTGAFAWRVCHSLAHLGGHHRSIRMAGMSLARSPWRAPQEHSHGGYVTRSLTLAGTTGAFAHYGSSRICECS